ncbi:hypothetical protein CWR48_00970 [Oceanobacillus arenosus]|uniref:TVP38/TMEM64 family membrane protein n=2 Tax=Oceanobacillus arenosus TaxID=1229153 RepID=A0A3D8Q3N8_9BACI|nr:hypothetical protein CWR48_00970 [Oceanobacillus arenosus]
MNHKNFVWYLMNFSTAIGMIVIAILLFYGYQKGLFDSTETLKQFIIGFGLWAPFIFVVVQMVQVIFPILPGAIGCVAGVIIFGPWMGFLYNYVGICMGSILVFILSRKYGVLLVKSLIKEKTYEKYTGWIEKGNKFEKIFACAIFFPVAPDDILCYIAGLTKMKFKKFVTIILLGKPLTIAVYSIGMTTVVNYLMNFIK